MLTPCHFRAVALLYWAGSLFFSGCLQTLESQETKRLMPYLPRPISLIYPVSLFSPIQRGKAAHTRLLPNSHPHQKIADGRPPPAIPRKLPREEASAFHRLKANCASTRSTLPKLQRDRDHLPTLRSTGEHDNKQVLLDCEEYEEERKVFLKCYASSGLPCSTTQKLPIPDATTRPQSLQIPSGLFTRDGCS